LCANDGIVGGGHCVAVDILLRGSLDVVAFLLVNEGGEGLEAVFAGDLSAGAALGFVGQVDVLERSGVPAVVDACCERGVEFALLFDGREDGSASFFEVAVVLEARID